MKITSATLFRLAALPVEAIAASVLFLAEQLEQTEASEERLAEIRRKDAERKRTKRGMSGDSPENVREMSGLARVEDKPLPSLKDSKITPPVPPSSQEHPSFGAFWEVYPKRAGTADRKGASKAFNAALKRVPFETIMWAVAVYAGYCRDNGKTGTEFVKQARSWLNADGWTETYDQGQRPNGPGNLTDAERQEILARLSA